MLTPGKLVQGEYYFRVYYHYPKINIPEIRTYIYIGKNLFPNEEEPGKYEWYFQDSESYIKHGSFLQMKKGAARDIFIADEDYISRMFDLDGLIEVLINIKKGD